MRSKHVLSCYSPLNRIWKYFPTFWIDSECSRNFSQICIKTYTTWNMRRPSKYCLLTSVKENINPIDCDLELSLNLCLLPGFLSFQVEYAEAKGIESAKSSSNWQHFKYLKIDANYCLGLQMLHFHIFIKCDSFQSMFRYFISFCSIDKPPK